MELREQNFDASPPIPEERQEAATVKGVRLSADIPAGPVGMAAVQTEQDGCAALTSGQLARYDQFDETRADFSRWKGIYATWRRRKKDSNRQVKSRSLEETFRFQPAY